MGCQADLLSGTLLATIFSLIFFSSSAKQVRQVSYNNLLFHNDPSTISCRTYRKNITKLPNDSMLDLFLKSKFKTTLVTACNNHAYFLNLNFNSVEFLISGLLEQLRSFIYVLRWIVKFRKQSIIRASRRIESKSPDRGTNQLAPRNIWAEASRSLLLINVTNWAHNTAPLMKAFPCFRRGRNYACV